MRKGMRSQRQLGKLPETSGSGVQKEVGDGIRGGVIVIDLSGYDMVPLGETLNSTIEMNDVVEQVGTEECGLDHGMSLSGNVNLAENERNGSCFGSGDKTRKENKGQGSNGKWSFGARILYSLLKNGDGKESDIKEKDGVFARKNREVDVFEIENENEEADMFSWRSSSSGKELEKQGFYGAKKSKFGEVSETENNVVASPLRSNNENGLVSENIIKIKIKQLLRKIMMEQLSAAGWEVYYIPSNGSEYNDAVYVSLDGKPHWSVTFAYNRLKRHYEAGDGEGKVYVPGFKFTPITDEIINMVAMDEKRKSKENLMHEGGEGGNTVDRVNKGKEKLGSGTGLGQPMKGNNKRKWSLVEEDNPDVTSPYRMPVQIRDHKQQKTQNKKPCVSLVRNAEKERDSKVYRYVSYFGKRTVLSWMIDLGTIQENENVYYMDHRRKCAVLDGKITRVGIHCGCCNEIVSISDFDAHSGSQLSDPLTNICIEGGTSLLQCMLESWNKQDVSEREGFHVIDVAGEDRNDDTCIVCGDGGDLICCDSCPSTFHQSCLDIQDLPSGDWHCVNCCCKFCGLVGESTNQMESKDDYVEFLESLSRTCRLCERRYHRSCLVANCGNIAHFRDAIFCGNSCQEISERLEMLIGVKHEIGDGLSWTFIRRSDVGSKASQTEPHMVECNSKLTLALSLMDQCFMPYIDHRSGINVIHSVLYNCGSNFDRLNYQRFVTAILERDDEITCAASIRIHGNQLAEMPFIATRYMYRRQGMCRRLLKAIESVLSSLNVELLVLPAISEVKETWTNVFGFEPLSSTTKQIIKDMNLLVFPDVEMLQKKISKHNFQIRI